MIVMPDITDTFILIVLLFRHEVSAISSPTVFKKSYSGEFCVLGLESEKIWTAARR
jgi:hypothetical protein